MSLLSRLRTFARAMRAPASRSGSAPHGSTSVWLDMAESGSVAGMRALAWLTTTLGRDAARPIVRLVALYYTLMAPQARAASRRYLQRVFAAKGRKSAPTRGEVYEHIATFAQVTLDRVLLVQGDLDPFRITRTGTHHLEDCLSRGQGAILLGAHMGSFEVMRVVSRTSRIPVNVLGYFDNAKMINSILRRLDPTTTTRLIALRPGEVDALLTAAEAIDRGEFVALLGDRTGLNDRTVEVEFLGAPAEVPAGPYHLAALTKAPVFLVAGLYEPPNQYHLHCRPLADTVVLPRGPARKARVRALAQEYMDWVASNCLEAPMNWFNFFDLWV